MVQTASEHRVNCWNAKGAQRNSYANQQPSHVKRNGSVEGSETRGVTSVTNNRPHECPAPHAGDDIVRHSEETRRAGVNSLCN